MRSARIVSAGEKEVYRELTEDDGTTLLRNFDLVERNLRRRRWGRNVGIEGQDIGILEELNASLNGAYFEFLMIYGSTRSWGWEVRGNTPPSLRRGGRRRRTAKSGLSG